jgi:mono/diheme cytochrome c family protein
MIRVLLALALTVMVPAAGLAVSGPAAGAAVGAKSVSADPGTLTGHAGSDGQTAALASALGIEFVEGSTSTVTVERGEKKYTVDLVARSIREVDPPSQPGTAGTTSSADGAAIFKKNCTPCHGPEGKGVAALKTPDFTDTKVQASLTDQRMLEIITNGKKDTMMPPWAGKLSDDEIRAVQSFVRSLGAPSAQPKSSENLAPVPSHEESKIYEPGDDLLFSLPTGRRLERHGVYANFTHRFAFDPAFSGTARGGALGGLDGFSLSSFGFRYGVTDKLSVSIYRSPTFIGRPIQMMAAYNFLDEHDGQPLNAAVRLSIEGENNFDRNFTENIEGVFSRSVTRRAQIYFVPTVSFNDHKLFSPNDYTSSSIPLLPGYDAVSLGVGAAVDVRPTVALVAEVIPTVVNGRPLDIHRPAYSFGIQKKIWRHAFTFGFTTSPGTTVSQRAGTRASFLNDPTADKPGGLVIGFDLTRQIR